MESQISKARNITGWVLNGLVSAVLTFSASGKLFLIPEVVEVLGNSGFGEYIQLLGVIELASVILFLIPKTRAYGMFAIVAYLGGVIAIECYVAEPPMPGIVLSIFFWVGVFLRKPHIFKG